MAFQTYTESIFYSYKIVQQIYNNSQLAASEKRGEKPREANHEWSKLCSDWLSEQSLHSDWSEYAAMVSQTSNAKQSKSSGKALHHHLANKF